MTVKDFKPLNEHLAVLMIKHSYLLIKPDIMYITVTHLFHKCIFYDYTFGKHHLVTNGPVEMI